MTKPGGLNRGYDSAGVETVGKIYLIATEREGVPGVPRRKLPPLRPLTEQQKKAVQMTYDCMPVQEIADVLGVHRSTIWRWKQTREFRADWHRIDRNWRRKAARMDAKLQAEEEAYWAAEQEKWEETLTEESKKIKKKPGRAWYAAYNNFWRAQFCGYSWKELMRMLETGKPIRRRRRRKK